MKNKNIMFIVAFLVVVVAGIFLIINLDNKKESGKNDNKDNKTDVKDNDKDKNSNNDNIVDLSTVKLGEEYQVICTYDATNGKYGTSTYQIVDTFYNDGTCKYEFSHENVYNNINDYNEAQNQIKDKENFDECINDHVFDDATMTIKTFGGMDHCYKDMGEDFCTDVKLNSTDELKEKIRLVLEQNQSRDNATCVLYKK